MIARFSIGTKFMSRGKVCEVVDIHRTYNNKNEIVSLRYVGEHIFLGQSIKTYDILDTTIARNLV